MRRYKTAFDATDGRGADAARSRTQPLTRVAERKPSLLQRSSGRRHMTYRLRGHAGTIPRAVSDLTDNLVANTKGNCPVTLTTVTPMSGDMARRMKSLGLRSATPDASGQAPSQRVPFVVQSPASEPWFSDPLPSYIDWKTFVYIDGPGPKFPHWLARLVPPDADVVPLAAPDPVESDWRSLGLFHPYGIPLLAERARPMLHRRRAWQRQELAARMPPAIARTPGQQAPRSPTGSRSRRRALRPCRSPSFRPPSGHHSSCELPRSQRLGRRAP